MQFFNMYVRLSGRHIFSLSLFLSVTTPGLSIYAVRLLAYIANYIHSDQGTSEVHLNIYADLQSGQHFQNNTFLAGLQTW